MDGGVFNIMDGTVYRGVTIGQPPVGPWSRVCYDRAPRRSSVRGVLRSRNPPVGPTPWCSNTSNPVMSRRIHTPSAFRDLPLYKLITGHICSEHVSFVGFDIDKLVKCNQTTTVCVSNSLGRLCHRPSDHPAEKGRSLCLAVVDCEYLLRLFAVLIIIFISQKHLLSQNHPVAFYETFHNGRGWLKIAT